MIDLATNRWLSPLGSAIGLSLALIVLFAICALVELLSPGVQITHAWVGLFTLASVNDAQAWLEGIFYSIVMGVIAGGIFAAAHNAVAKRGL